MPTATVAPHLSDLDRSKAACRATALQARAACDPAVGSLLASHLLGTNLIPPGVLVAGFWPLPGEIDLRPLLHTLHDRGHPLALPRTPARGEALSFHRWAPGEPLAQGPFGTRHANGPAVLPQVVLVPLLAFDETGARLGYGAGYYDRTLAALPGVLAIGCAFAAQQVHRVPVGSHDIPLAAVLTERGMLHTA